MTYILTRTTPTPSSATMDGAFIPGPPIPTTSTIRNGILAWLDEGNKPTPYKPPPAAKPAPKTG